MKLSIYKSTKFTSILLEQDLRLRIEVGFKKVVSMDQLVLLMLTTAPCKAGFPSLDA